MPTGSRPGAFRCAPEDEETVRLVLLRFAFIEPGSVRYRDGRVEYAIDIGRLGHGDGPAADLMVTRELERCVSLHRAPSAPSPKDEP